MDQALVVRRFEAGILWVELEIRLRRPGRGSITMFGVIPAGLGLSPICAIAGQDPCLDDVQLEE